MTGLTDVYGFKILIQVCILLDFPPPADKNMNPPSHLGRTPPPQDCAGITALNSSLSRRKNNDIDGTWNEAFLYRCIQD